MRRHTYGRGKGGRGGQEAGGDRVWHAIAHVAGAVFGLFVPFRVRVPVVERDKCVYVSMLLADIDTAPYISFAIVGYHVSVSFIQHRSPLAFSVIIIGKNKSQPTTLQLNELATSPTFL